MDWAHLSVMWTAWYFRWNQIYLSTSLRMPTGFAILNSFSNETLARQIRTNPEQEYIFLQFLIHLKQMRNNLTTYSVLACIAGTSLTSSVLFLYVKIIMFSLDSTVLLFIIRLLKAADFQQSIALVTRTLSKAMSDLIHFIILFVSITIGYSIAGVLLFGHQYDAFVQLQNVMISLVVMLIQWDPYQWIQVIRSFSKCLVSRCNICTSDGACST